MITTLCGYFDEHSDEEVLNCNAFSNALNFLNEVIEKIGYEQHYHKSPKYQPLAYYNNKKWEDPRDYSKLFEDYDDTVIIPDKQGVRHDCEGFSYTDYDSLQWVEECLEYGECPHCQSNNLVEQVDTSILCTNCDGKWNIPLGDVLMKHTREEWEY